MDRINWKSLSIWLGIAALFVLASGVLSYFTADGLAVIGPNPVNVSVQREEIAMNTLQWIFFLGAAAIGAQVLNRRLKH